MDPVTLASTVAGLLSPLLMKGLEEVAKSGLKDLYTTVKEKLSGDPEGKQAVERFEKSPETAEPDFQAVLQKHLESDQAFYASLLMTVRESQPSIRGNISIGKIDANKVVVAEKIDRFDMGS